MTVDVIQPNFPTSVSNDSSYYSCIILVPQLTTQLCPLVGASLGTAQGRGGALVVDGDTTFPALVGGIAHMAKMIPLVRAFGGTTQRTGCPFAFQHRAALFAAVVLSTDLAEVLPPM